MAELRDHLLHGRIFVERLRAYRVVDEEEQAEMRERVLKMKF